MQPKSEGVERVKEAEERITSAIEYDISSRKKKVMSLGSLSTRFTAARKSGFS